MSFRHPCHIRGWSKGWRARGDGDALEDVGEGDGGERARFWGNRQRGKGAEKRGSGRKTPL